MKDARKHSHIKILVGGNNNTWITFSELAYAQRVEGRNRRDELSTRGQVYGRRHGVTAPQEPQYTDAEQGEFHMFELRESRKEMKSRGGTPISWHRMYIGLYRRGGEGAAGRAFGMAKWGALIRSARVGCCPTLYFRA